jgi:hypothetical protein
VSEQSTAGPDADVPGAAPAEAAPAGGTQGAPEGAQEMPPDLVWAQGFHMAARAFATERDAKELHITITLANGESIPVISVGPGGPPGFVGFGVETEGLREQMEESSEPVPSPRGVYVPIGSIAKIEFSAEKEEAHAVGFHVERAMDDV